MRQMQCVLFFMCVFRCPTSPHRYVWLDITNSSLAVVGQ